MIVSFVDLQNKESGDLTFPNLKKNYLDRGHLFR